LRGAFQHLYLRSKSRWADYMERQSSRLSRKGHYLLFGLFICIASIYCCLLIWSGGLLVNRHSIGAEPISTIRTPSPPVRFDTRKDTMLLERIRTFRSYMADLETSESGRRTRDSILKARPGLMDSIRIAESLFNNQKENNHEK